MANKTNNLTRGDKIHLKFMDKVNATKDSVNQGIAYSTKVHKQSLDSVTNHYEAVTKSQDKERDYLYKIISNPDIPKDMRQDAQARLRELDAIKKDDMNDYQGYAEDQGEKTNKFILLTVSLLAVGLVGGKQSRQKLVSLVKNIPRLK